MISRTAKALYYAALGPVFRVSNLIHRFTPLSQRYHDRVQLGPGQRNHLSGWTNVDANLFTARVERRADLNHGLPFKDNTVGALYSHHVIEHLRDRDFHWSEVARVLKPGGVFRVGAPHGGNAMLRCIAGDNDWFSDFPVKRQSTGNRLENFLLCKGEHVGIITEDGLIEDLQSSGLQVLGFCKPKHSELPEIFDSAVMALEYESRYDFPHTLIVEGRKPHQ